MSCPICYGPNNYVKCNDCVDGGVCVECVREYCPVGFCYTSKKDQTRCPVCRTIQYKWIYEECISNIVQDMVYFGRYDLPVVDILERNILL